MLQVVLDATQLGPERVRPLRRVEYEKMVDLGCFEDERLELLRGALVTMSPQGSRHAEVVARMNTWLLPSLLGRAVVRVQSPLALAEDSEPEPDVAVVPPGDYSGGHPQTAWLVIEVADESLRKDRDVKAGLYAAAGIQEYWLVNLVDRVVDVHRHAVDGAYRQVTRCHIDGKLRIDKFPDLAMALADLLPRAGRHR